MSELTDLLNSGKPILVDVDHGQATLRTLYHKEDSFFLKISINNKVGYAAVPSTNDKELTLSIFDLVNKLK